MNLFYLIFIVITIFHLKIKMSSLETWKESVAYNFLSTFLKFMMKKKRLLSFFWLREAGSPLIGGRHWAVAE